jgi:hypothetical protein
MQLITFTFFFISYTDNIKNILNIFYIEDNPGYYV